MGILSESNKCFESFPEKYPEIDKNQDLQNKVMAMVEKKCPNPATTMMNKQ